MIKYIYGQKLIHCLIKNADSGLIKERFLLESVNGMDPFITLLPSKYHQLYIQRMVNDWSKGKVRDIFNNNNMKIHHFRQMFLSHLKTLDVSYQKQIAHTRNMRQLSNDYDEYNSLSYCCRLGDIALVQWCCSLDVDVNM